MQAARSITQGQLYGENDEATHEWTAAISDSGLNLRFCSRFKRSCAKDGILALTVRHASAAEQSKRHVIQEEHCEPLNAMCIAGFIRSVRAFSHASPIACSA